MAKRKYDTPVAVNADHNIHIRVRKLAFGICSIVPSSTLDIHSYPQGTRAFKKIVFHS